VYLLWVLKRKRDRDAVPDEAGLAQ